MRQERGFTLIELLIVLAILGILVGIVAMSVGGLTDTATKRSMSSEYETVQTAIDTYQTQDVAVEGGTTLTATDSLSGTNAVQIDVDDAHSDTIGQYLKRDTKYYFVWEAGGENLGVYEEPADGALHFDGSDWYNEE